MVQFVDIRSFTTAALMLWAGLCCAAQDTSEYIGGEVCARCHTEQARSWRGSHHDLAMQPATEQTVLGDFDDVQFTHAGVTSRFYRRDGRHLVRTDSADGDLAEFEVRYTFGVEPLQQYLVDYIGGRLQALPIAWDTRPVEQGGQKWFHLYPGQRIEPGDPLHWTGPNQNWNFMCAECHSTNLHRNYDAGTDRYETTWSEADVACEACHGPGSRHVAWVESGGAGNGVGFAVDLKRRGGWSMDAATGIARNPEADSSLQIETCARCHARRIGLGGDYRPGLPFTDFYRPQVLLEGLYFADGQIRDEVYVYGSFLQSKMYRSGVTCSDCHDAHSLKLKSEGNALCAGCHLAERFDTAEHHFHQSGTEAARCVSCHMPARTYMVNDDRRDHSFRVPRPDLSGRMESPDACTGCHQDRSQAWAADVIRDRADRRRPADFHYGVAIQAGRSGALDGEERLIELAQDPEMPDIARATAAALLGRYLSPVSLQAIAGLLEDGDALVRVNALSVLDGLDPRLKTRLAADLLSDPARMVRIEAANLLADVPGELFTDRQRQAFGGAVDDYIAVQENNADRAESWTNLGNLHLRLGNADKALAQYQRAIDLDPRYAPAYVNLADLYRVQQQDDKARRLLEDALNHMPDVASLHHAYGLLLVRENQKVQAVDALQRAAALEPANVRFRYVYALALDSVGDLDDALAELEEANAIRPADRGVLIALVHLNRRAGKTGAARRYAADLVELSPWDRNAHAVLQQLSN